MLECQISTSTANFDLQMHTFKEVRFKVDIKDVAAKTLDGVIEG
jgi:hypothetical protein